MTAVLPPTAGQAARARAADPPDLTPGGTGRAGAGDRLLRRMVAPARRLRGRLALAALAGAGTVGCSVGLLAVSGWLLARASEHPPLVVLSLAVVAVRALGLGRGVLRYLERLTTHDVAFRALADTRAGVYEKLTRLAPDGLRRYRATDLLTRLVSDVDSVQDLLVRGVVPPLAAAAAGAAATGLAAALLLPAGLVLGAGLLLAGAALPLALAAAPDPGLVAARARLAVATGDLLDGAPELLAYGGTDAALARIDAIEAEAQRAAGRRAAVEAAGTAAGTVLAGGTVWLVLLLGVAAVDGGTLGRVPLAVLVLTALAAFEAVAPLPAAAAQLAATRAAGRRLFGVLDGADTAPRPADPRPLPAGPYTLRVAGARVEGRLSGVDLTLAPGRRVALVGPSGCGKSTLAAVLFRFRDLDGGTAELNGVPLADLDPDRVREVIGGLPADPHLFDTSVRENLRLARPDATDGELAGAAGRAGLLDWIEALPAGWDTAVGSHGDLLSGGERQRLALARALLADPPILVLDEPTTHLDPATAAALMDDLLAATAGRTVLLITHDRTALRAVDEIVHLGGRSES